MRWFFLLFSLAFASPEIGSAGPNPNLLGETTPSLYLGAQSFVQLQDTDPLTLTALPQEQGFHPLAQDHPNFGLETKALWLWNRLQSDAGRPLSWVLDTGFANNNCRLFLGPPGGPLREVPLWQPGHWNRLFQFQLAPGEVVHSFVACQTDHASLNPDMILHSEKSFWQQEILYRVFQGVYFG